MKGSEYLCRYKKSVVITEEYNVRVNSGELLPQNIGRYRRGVALTDVVITGFDCTPPGFFFHYRNVIPYSDYNN